MIGRVESTVECCERKIDHLTAFGVKGKAA